MDHTKLREDLVVRRHVSGDADWMVVHDERNRRVYRFDRTQVRVASLANGHRTIEEMLEVADEAGIEITEHDLREFITDLGELGLLEIDVAAAERPLRVLDGFRFSCTGRGHCCEVFPSVLFSDEEVDRARRLLPDHPHDFLPVRGWQMSGFAVPPLHHGRCDYLDDGGACRLHSMGGPMAKPAGCRHFPTTLVDDGEVIRVSAAVECPCVVDGIGVAGESGLVASGATRRSDLDPTMSVKTLPDQIEVTQGVFQARALVVELLDAVACAPPPADVAAGLWALGQALQRDATRASVVDYEASPSIEADDEVRGWLRAASLRFERWATTLRSFRSEEDRSVRAVTAMAKAAAQPAGPPHDPRIEAFYVRAGAFGADWIGDAPLADAVRIRAIRVWIARALARDGQADPLPLVEAMFRAHGLDAFRDEATP